ncbi:leucine-rich repeat and immunoglobulin-like domain-containing nogo receptor-interacting protein 3 isoform X2 [Dendroctonus ponderosae]
MDLFTLVVGILCLSLASNAEETFENSTNLCEKCKCINGPQFVLDCQKQDFHHMIANWPEHNVALIATFSYNNISNVEILPDSDLVTKVILSHCGIKSVDNGAFKTVKYLTYLDLSYNLLTTEEISPEIFKGTYNNTVYEPLMLEDLDLSHNEIHSLPHNIFEHLTTLKQLNLAGNNLRVLDPPTQMALSGLTNLQVLNIADNDLTDLVEDAVRNLQKLRILNLTMNLLDFVPDTLSLLSNSLEAVYLDHNLIFEITDESFLGVKGIKVLSLTNLPRLQYVNANSFAHLQNLSILYLSDNPSLTTIDRDAFGKGQVLEELYLHSNSLQDLHYNLTNWSALRLFTLKDNSLFCDCDLYEISQALSSEIKMDKDGPFCINPITDVSMMIYNLTEEACSFDQYTYRASHLMDSHFHTIKLVFIILLVIATLIAFVALAIALLRCYRFRINQNYPFPTQVMYNPLRTQNIN